MNIKLTDWKIQLIRIMIPIERYENLPKRKFVFYLYLLFAMFIFANGGFLAYLLNLDNVKKTDQKFLKISPFSGIIGVIAFYCQALIGRYFVIKEFSFLNFQFSDHWYHGISTIYYVLLGVLSTTLVGIAFFTVLYGLIYLYKKIKSFGCTIIVFYTLYLSTKKQKNTNYINYEE